MNVSAYVGQRRAHAIRPVILLNAMGPARSIARAAILCNNGRRSLSMRHMGSFYAYGILCIMHMGFYLPSLLLYY